MIKNKTAYSFTLLANIVLLAHVVLPHHHHEQQVCIERTHCVDDEIAHNHNIPEKDHQHDGNTNADACVLKQAVLSFSSQSKLLKNCDNCTDNQTNSFFILSNFRYLDAQPVSETVTYTPKLSAFFTTFITPTLGLRAPPTA